MTRPIQLSYGSESGETSVANVFIDEYMSDANGAYVKVYLYLLRCLGDPSMSVSVAAISEKLDETEKDIVKALRYWEKQNLLHIVWDGDGQISRITLEPLTGSGHRRDNIITLSVAEPQAAEADSPAAAPVPVRTSSRGQAQASQSALTAQVSRPDYSSRQIAKFKQHDDFNELIDFIEERLGCTMKLSDLQTPAFLYEQLEMSAPLIRYLYDYCIYKGKTAPSYIEKVAMAWHDKGIDSVEAARADVFARSKDCSAVRSAFGITRPFGAVEYEFISRWKFTYGMSTELIREACNRAILNSHCPDFKYAEGVLSRWHKKGITDMDGVAAEDAAHAALPAANTRQKTSASGNRFNDFQQRSYSESDYADMERKKLGKL